MKRIDDIAKEAGVSRATVSRVLNGHLSVTPETARHVKRAMEQAGYVPAVNRRGPRPKGKTIDASKVRSVVLLLMGHTHELLEQPSVRRLLAGFTSSAQASDIHSALIEMPDPMTIPQVVRDRTADGLVVSGEQSRPEWVDMFHPIPFVAEGGAALPDTVFDHVLVNNAQVGRIAARYLLEAGCRNLAYLNNDAGHTSFAPRLKVFQEETGSAGARLRTYELPDRDLPEADYWTTLRLRADFTELIDRMLADGGMPDGIHVPTDQQAATLHALLRERGLGEGLVTISCNNDVPWLSTIHPRPATIDMRGEEIGRQALGRLLERIENPGGDFTVTLVTPRLVLPES